MLYTCIASEMLCRCDLMWFLHVMIACSHIYDVCVDRPTLGCGMVIVYTWYDKYGILKPKVAITKFIFIHTQPITI